MAISEIKFTVSINRWQRACLLIINAPRVLLGLDVVVPKWCVSGGIEKPMTIAQLKKKLRLPYNHNPTFEQMRAHGIEPPFRPKAPIAPPPKSKP